MSRAPVDASDEELRAVQQGSVLSAKMQRLLKGQGQMAQMVALADCVSIFIAGHVGRDEKETAEARAWGISEFLRIVQGLVDLSAAQRGLPHGPINSDPATYAAEKLGRKN